MVEIVKSILRDTISFLTFAALHALNVYKAGFLQKRRFKPAPGDHKSTLCASLCPEFLH
jgi:hypothetical protein